MYGAFGVGQQNSRRGHVGEPEYPDLSCCGLGKVSLFHCVIELTVIWGC